MSAESPVISYEWQQDLVGHRRAYGGGSSPTAETEGGSARCIGPGLESRLTGSSIEIANELSYQVHERLKKVSCFGGRNTCTGTLRAGCVAIDTLGDDGADADDFFLAAIVDAEADGLRRVV